MTFIHPLLYSDQPQDCYNEALLPLKINNSGRKAPRNGVISHFVKLLILEYGFKYQGFHFVNLLESTYLGRNQESF